VVIGASYAGVQGALYARDSGYSEPITIVADEEWMPYQRPPLSKDFLVDLATEENLVLRDKAFFASKGIDLMLGARATDIDRNSRKLVLGGHSELAFDKLLIATGSHARKLPVPGADLDGVRHLRTMQDAIDLKASLRGASEIVVVGGGFIGLEVAASASKLGKKVTVLESANRLLERAVSPTLSEFLLDMHMQHDVDVRLGETVVSIEGQSGRVASVGRPGDQMAARRLIAGGISPHPDQIRDPSFDLKSLLKSAGGAGV
jgi:3-phenylpropionate/trans-cinnamate dioxygenase ferredoxin reductase subunit